MDESKCFTSGTLLDALTVRAVAVALRVEYTDEYPDAVPHFSIEVERGEMDETEIKQLLGELEKVVCPFLSNAMESSHFDNLQGEENLGMAMTFTIVTHLRERLSSLVREREERIRKEDTERERRALEVCSATRRPREHIPIVHPCRQKKQGLEAPPLQSSHLESGRRSLTRKWQ